MKNEKPPKKGWDELVFGALEKIAAAPVKLKDPSLAIDWVKALKEDIQEKIRKDVAERFSQVDWESISKKVGQHLADKYDIEVNAKVSLKKKKRDSDDEDSE